MILDSLSMRSLRTVSTVAVALALSACAASAPPPPVSAPSAPPVVQAPAPQRAPAPAPVAQAPAPAPVVVQQITVPQPAPAAPAPMPAPTPVVQQAPPPATVAPSQVAAAPAPRIADQQVVVGGTAFPVDGTPGRVPPGSRLVVRVYDASLGDVNIRVAEGAFDVARGLPARYRVPTPAQSVEGMELPAVAARVEGPRGRVIYRNEVAVLLKSGAAGDIPMTLQRVQAASSGTAKTWDTPSVE